VWALAAFYWLVATAFFRGDDYLFWDTDDKVPILLYLLIVFRHF
jgi:hypothetical protein